MTKIQTHGSTARHGFGRVCYESTRTMFQNSSFSRGSQEPMIPSVTLPWCILYYGTVEGGSSCAPPGLQESKFPSKRIVHSNRGPFLSSKMLFPSFYLPFCQHSQPQHLRKMNPFALFMMWGIYFDNSTLHQISACDRQARNTSSRAPEPELELIAECPCHCFRSAGACGFQSLNVNRDPRLPSSHLPQQLQHGRSVWQVDRRTQV